VGLKGADLLPFQVSSEFWKKGSLSWTNKIEISIRFSSPNGAELVPSIAGSKQ